MDIDRLKVHPLPDADPLPFQLRVVIWKPEARCFRNSSVHSMSQRVRHNGSNHVNHAELTRTVLRPLRQSGRHTGFELRMGYQLE
eukprot:4236824-Amphidinium_carterae.1